MKKLRQTLSVSLFAGILLIGCQPSSAPQSSPLEPQTYPHATLLTYFNGVAEPAADVDVTKYEVRNPWDTLQVLHRYYLVNREDSARWAPPSDGETLYLPLRRVVVFTSAHTQLLCWLGQAEKIVGLCDVQYVNIPDMQARVARGTIADCGNSMQPDIEKIILSRPDAILLSPFQNSGDYGRLGKLNIPLVECADYMESTPLARAEWMRFYGRLMGREEQADSLFGEVQKNYQTLKAEAQKSTTRPVMITEEKTGSVWYCPGGRSSVAQLIADAGGKYLFADDPGTASVPHSPEKILERAGQVDVWAFKYNAATPLTLSRLKSQWHGYQLLKAVQTGQVYGANCTQVPYFEQTSFRPDWLLGDFIRMLHPDAEGSAAAPKLRYYHRL